MKIKVSQFCGLSTSPQWQAWLYRHNNEIYTQFAEEMRLSKGCAQNSEIMLKYLNKLEAMGSTPAIVEWLKVNFPHVLEADPVKQEVLTVSPETDEMNRYKAAFGRGLVTFPRRALAPLINVSLDKMLEDFQKSTNAIKTKFVVVDNVIYMEFLLPCDETIKNNIRESNWLVPRMRQLIHAQETS